MSNEGDPRAKKPFSQEEKHHFAIEEAKLLAQLGDPSMGRRYLPRKIRKIWEDIHRRGSLPDEGTLWAEHQRINSLQKGVVGVDPEAAMFNEGILRAIDSFTHLEAEDFKKELVFD